MQFVIWSNKWSTWDFCASAVRANYQNEIWFDSLPVAIQDPNNQTKFLFDKAQLSLPTVQETLQEWASICLVNHSSQEDSIWDRDSYTIAWLIDSHPIDLWLKYNIEARTSVVWSTSTVIAEYFLDKVFVPELNYIILLCAWIVVDTNNFTNDESTNRDEEAFHRLKELANLEDFEEFIKELLEISS